MQYLVAAGDNSCVTSYIFTGLHGHAPRKRRSVQQGSLEVDEPIPTNARVVLLESLGNAGLPQSRDILLQHMEPNRGDHAWRRSAINALRKYSCNMVKTTYNKLTINM